MIVPGGALAVITLYIIPVDQLVSAVTGPPGLSRAIQHIQDTRDRLAIRLAGHPDVLAHVDAHLLIVQNHLSDVLYKIGNYL